MRLREQFPDFFRLARGLRSMKFDFKAGPAPRKTVTTQDKNGDPFNLTDVNYQENPEAVLADDVELEEATLLTSRHQYGRQQSQGKGMHRVVLDLDMDAALIESTTPGHHHLIIDKVIPWPNYVNLLKALADAGIIERGYCDAAIAKGYTAIRPPWVKKEKKALRDPFKNIVNPYKDVVAQEAISFIAKLNASYSDPNPFLPVKGETTWLPGDPTPTQSVKPATSSQTDGAKGPSTKTVLAILPSPSPPAEKPAASSEPSNS